MRRLRRLALAGAVSVGSIWLIAPVASAEVPCSGQLPNGGYYDLGSTCHATWDQAERDIEQTMVIVNNVLGTVEGEAQDVIDLGNQLVENTEVFVNQVLDVPCQVRPDICGA